MSLERHSLRPNKYVIVALVCSYDNVAPWAMPTLMASEGIIEQQCAQTMIAISCHAHRISAMGPRSHFCSTLSRGHTCCLTSEEKRDVQTDMAGSC